MNNAPLADTGTADEKEKIRAIVARRGLSGAANNTKWNELINCMRQQDEWWPSYRAVAGAECNTVIELKLEHHAA